jgi:DNA-binding GntR family transcriptional regulator
MMRKVFEANTRIIISSKQNEVEIHDARAEHRAILRLLQAGKTEKAAAEMLEHVRHCERAAMEFFYNSSALPSASQAEGKTPLMYLDSLRKLRSA